MRTEYLTHGERTQRRLIDPSQFPDLERGAARAERHGLSARRTPGLASDHWLVESASDPTLLHTVIIAPAGSQLVANCDCIGWASYRICQHIAVAAKTAGIGPWQPAEADPILAQMEQDRRDAHGMLAHALRYGDPREIAACRRDLERTEAAIIRERASRSAVPA